ncbi:ABC transporter ATP-binding protein [Corynebacterium sp. 13CS0277]|uniref:ABC transporter ATP-binding protein n=1 Tax=Corynebacterium sp. 13CS0277 TaxID=2071994 RepID=UPI000D033162|nr:ABC transporter ATP-binding protein [Corynebacterium sp. 13CS0277]PRQ11468.1 ABC transporter ATP-binding protein [Corynebacterium sp. 13CS0277]
MLLRDISFTVPAGSRTALIGVNGVGKSTLLRTIAGLSAPAAGEVLVGGRDVTRLKHRARARVLTLVGQEELPPADLSIREVVQLGRLPYRASWALGSKEDRRIVDDALAKVDLLALADRPLGQLSGGQRRRAVIARGLAQTTPVVLLDEPTNHLDVHHQLHLLQLLAGTGRTILATVHDLDLAMCFFDQVVVLGEGGMLAAGPPAEVLTRETVRRAFDVGAVRARPDGAEHLHLIVDTL